MTKHTTADITSRRVAAFEPISRETVSSQIRAQLLRRITTGELQPGEKMPSERDLSEQFQVARTSVREAIQGLLSLEVIERRGNRTYIAERLPDVVVSSSSDPKTFVTELFETRRALEVPIFELAASRADDGGRRKVAELSKQFDTQLDIETFRRLDREFHTTIAACCGNPLLIELYSKVLEQLFRSSEFDALLSDEQNKPEVRRLIVDSSKDHRTITEAFVRADPAAIREAAEAHLSSVEQSMVDKLI